MLRSVAFFAKESWRKLGDTVMARSILHRLLLLIPVWLGVSGVVFLTLSLVPGDPALAILGPYATPESLATLRGELGLDQPLVDRYFIWLGNILQGDMGQSISLHRPVATEILERLGPTLLLAGSALFLATFFGLLAGIVSAIQHNRFLDRLVTILVLSGISLPSFWLALLFILIFSVQLGWFPVSGMMSVYQGGDWLDRLHHLVLPVVSLALVAGGVIARLSRSAMLEVLRLDHIRMLRAKGVPERRILGVHALRHTLAAIMPVIGLQAGFLLGGAVYIERVFQWPGLGRLLVDAIASRDLLLVQGGVLVMASFYVLINLVTDLLQHWLDPRGVHL